MYLYQILHLLKIKVSLETYRLIKLFENNEFENEPKAQDLKSQYNILTDIITNILYVKVFITFDSTFSFVSLQELGGKIGVRTSRIITATVPLDKLSKIAELQGLRRISIGETLTPNLDKAIPITNINKVHSGAGLKRSYTGAGVIVGVTDWGFDFTHEMFSDASGAPRITRAWITQDNTGVPPHGYQGGTLYTNANYLKNMLKCTNNKDNHGTHVLGIVGGRKVAAQKRTYTGVAPAAELIVAELYGVTKVSAPSVTLIETVEYMFKYADSVKKPIVINMSLGTNHHPGDGTSERDIMLSELLRSDTTGKIIVASAGNAGNSYIHKLHKFTSNKHDLTVNNTNKLNKLNENNADTIAVTSLWSNNYGNRNINLYGVNPGENFSVRAEIYLKQQDISSKTMYFSTSVDMNMRLSFMYVSMHFQFLFLPKERR